MITMPLIPPNKKIPSLTTSVAVTSILNSHVYRGPRPSETRPYPTRPSGNVHQENVFLNQVQLG